MANDKTVTNYKYFIIAEILAVASFALNAINVLSAKEIHAEFASAWTVEFGAIHWLKTILAILGLIYFFKAHIVWKKTWMSLIFFCTVIVLCYSIPIINTFLEFEIGRAYRFIRGFPSMFEYRDRLIILFIWSIPVLIILSDLLRRGANAAFNRGQHA